MKKLANTFLIIGKILAILGVIGFAIGGLIYLIGALIGCGALFAESTEAGIAGIVTAVFGFIGLLILGALCIVSLVLTNKAKAGLAAAKCKADARKPAIMAIIAGALLSTFPIASGIIMLVAKESVFTGEEPAVEAKDAEPVEAEVVE